MPGETEHVSDLSSSSPTHLIPTRRSTRTTVIPDRYGFSESAHSAVDHDHPTYDSALNGSDAACWRAAMTEEFDSLIQHSVGELVEPPPDANVIGGMWIFSRKRDEHNRIIRHKARWVAFGNHQINGVDYSDTYASVGKINSLRILLSLCLSKSMFVRQFDVKMAFLNGDMKDIVYARQVRGFEHPTKHNLVWLLNRSLYGTKQAAR